MSKLALDRIPVAGLLLLILTACGGGGGGGTGGDPGTGGNPTATTAWTAFVGTHYERTPNGGQTRRWAGGGLRDPGGNGTNYQPVLTGGVYTDSGYNNFTSKALPVINELLGLGQPAVVTVGGLSGASSTVFLDGMASAAGREAYRKAIHDRVDGIRALTNAAGWERKIYFQFGNEISNNNSTGFYGVVCLWVTKNATTNCDLVTQFVPTYVEYYLAPGIAHLEAKSQTLFGRPDALHVMLGSVVNLTNREAFVDALLNYRIQGTYASTYQNRYVYELVDTVSIHYTVIAPTYLSVLDSFRAKWVTGGPANRRVRALWSTEEVGVRAAEEGYGMAVAMRGIARYLSWWQANSVSPDDGHYMVWGPGINAPDGGSCPGCTSIDQDMPLLHDFTGDNALTAITQNRAVFVSSGALELHEFAVGGADKRVLVAFTPDRISASLTSVTLNLGVWSGKTVTLKAYRLSNRGPQLLGTAPAAVAASGAVTFSVPGTLVDNDVLLLLVQAT